MNKIVEVFDAVQMPGETEMRIRRALQEKERKARKYVVRRSPAAMLLVAAVLVLAMSTEVRAAVSGLVVKYFFPDSDITIYEELDESGDPIRIAGVDTEAPGFARIVNNRMYFLGNGERIDITDQITEEAPYYYTYVDDYGLTHYMAVAFSGTIENFGIYEFIREENGDWVTGTGRNFLNPETETRYPWVELVWAKWDIPWPMPE